MGAAVLVGRRLGRTGANFRIPLNPLLPLLALAATAIFAVADWLDPVGGPAEPSEPRRPLPWQPSLLPPDGAALFTLDCASELERAGAD